MGASDETGDMVRVWVETGHEIYPAVDIGDRGEARYDVPAGLLRDLRVAEESRRVAERVVMEHLARSYPDDPQFFAWRDEDGVE